MSNTRTFFYNYTNFINDRNKFRIVDNSGINRFDTPAALYYKIVFYFSDNGGLLGIDNISSSENSTNTVEKITSMSASFKNKNENDRDNTSKNMDTNLIKNSAYNFLLMNDELERAELLKQFIILLSNINSESPWYFQEIGGLDSALERKVFSDGEMKLEDSKKQITIKCLSDAYDNRIGTLLDLYRAACFSYQNKKEIVPANLRKFNMGVLLFNAPIRCKTGKSADKLPYITIPFGGGGAYIPSAKLIELRNCEFDYNSAKSAFGTINTTDDPFDPEYTITINFDECYESRYNEIMKYIVTDFINIDLNPEYDRYEEEELSDIQYSGNDIDIDDKTISDIKKSYWTDTDIETLKDRISEGNIKERKFNDTVGNAFLQNVITSQINNVVDQAKEIIQIPKFKSYENIHNRGTVNQVGEFEYLNHITGNNGLVGTLATQAVGMVTKPLTDKLKSLYLGNIRGKSVSNMIDATKRILSGDVFGSKNSIEGLVNAYKQEEKIEKKLEEKNLFSAPAYEYNINTSKGKINKAKSARNNI